MCEVRLEPPARRYFKKIRDRGLSDAFKSALLSIAKNPFIGQQKKGNLKDYFGYDVYYARTNYEIAYRIEEIDGRKVIVILAGPRENFYERLGRLVN